MMDRQYGQSRTRLPSTRQVAAVQTTPKINQGSTWSPLLHEPALGREPPRPQIEAEARRAEEPGDIVKQVNEQVRKHPVAAWGIIGFIAVTALLTFINQLIQFLKNVGWLAG